MRKQKQTRVTKKLLSAVLLLVFAFAFLSGCGEAKLQEDKVIRIDSPATDSKEALLQISEFYDVYASDKGFTPAEIEVLATKFKSQLESVTGVRDLPVEEIMETLVQLSPESVSGISLSQVANRITKHLGMFHWFDQKHELSIDELEVKLAGYFADSSEGSRKYLLQVLGRFDKPLVGGNANGLISKKELALAILIMSTVSKFSYAEGLLPFDVEGTTVETLTRKQFALKLEQQVYGRVPTVKSFKELSSPDLKLEVLTLALRIFQTTATIQQQGMDGSIFPAGFNSAIEALTDHTVDGVFLAKIYDRKEFGGNEDGNLNALELFLLSSDVEFSNQYLQTPSKKLTAIFPKLKTRPEKKEDLTKQTFYFAKMHLANLLLEMYDASGDGKITRQEAKSLFRKMGVSDETSKNAFFEGVGLDPGSSRIWAAIKLAIPFGRKKELTSSEFFTRLDKVVTREINLEKDLH